MQRIFNFDEWAQMSPEFVPSFGAETSPARVVVLEVNAEDKCKLFVRTNDGQEHFLALVEGRDEIQFSVEGEWGLVVVGGMCNIKTAEMQDMEMQPVDDTTFTTLMERRVRNPELEMMMFLANQNVEKRLAEQSAEFDRRLAARDAARDLGTASGTLVQPVAKPADQGAASGSTAGGTGETPVVVVAPGGAPESAPAPTGGGASDAPSA